MTHFSLLYSPSSPFVNIIFTTYSFVHKLYLPLFYLHSTLKTPASPEHPNEIKELNEQTPFSLLNN